MPRLVDCHCSNCDNTYEIICSVDEQPKCPSCSTPMQQHWWTRSDLRSTVWHPSEWATVFRKPDGSYSFPAISDKPTPPGCERITLKSDSDMARIEREANVRSERRWYDKGSGRGNDDSLPSIPVRR